MRLGTTRFTVPNVLQIAALHLRADALVLPGLVAIHVRHVELVGVGEAGWEGQGGRWMVGWWDGGTVGWWDGGPYVTRVDSS